jgi:hypothetical protein
MLSSIASNDGSAETGTSDSILPYERWLALVLCPMLETERRCCTKLRPMPMLSEPAEPDVTWRTPCASWDGCRTGVAGTVSLLTSSLPVEDAWVPERYRYIPEVCPEGMQIVASVVLAILSKRALTAGFREELYR